LKSDEKNEYVTNFEFKLLDNNNTQLSEYQGKIVLLNFFGVNCGYCKWQMVDLAEIYKNYKDLGVEIISINVYITLGETIEYTQQMITEAKEQGVYLNWTFGVDDTSGTLANKYAKDGVPQLYLLDKNGNVYNSWLGYTEYSVIVQKLEELI